MLKEITRLAPLIFATLLCPFSIDSSHIAHSVQQNQKTNAMDVKALFEKDCAQCHGKDGRGQSYTGKFLTARDFTDLRWQEDITEERIISSDTINRAKIPYVGNNACATCHSSIYQSYSRHPMALDSGVVEQDLIPGSFKHSLSSVIYRIYQEGTKAMMSYERPGDPTMRGSQELHYFIGSGKMIRGYLYSIDGFLYQTPVSYNVQKGRWDISPGYESSREMPNRPVDESCLFCHASQLQPIHGTQNRFASPPFTQNGVSCERCHGPGGEHVKGLGPMVNPAKLTAERRDSICAQCHLTGEARIQRPGKSISMYRPGDLLSDYVSYFIYEGKDIQGLKVVSHVEALAQSVCKQRSGDRMSCLSCHDPHSVPADEQRLSYFRGKCLSCHLEQNNSAFKKQHFSNNKDCISCHMSRTPSLDIAHTTLTDHRILRKPLKQLITSAHGRRLTQFGSKEIDQRGLGLAYAEVALRAGDQFFKSEAFRLLTESLPRFPKDPEVLTRLAYLHQGRGEINRAVTLYEAALREDPYRIVAAVNLGVIYAERGMIDRAIFLWRSVFERNPGSSEAGINLAVAVCAKGDHIKAGEFLRKVLYFNPDSGIAKQLLRELEGGRMRCRSHP